MTRHIGAILGAAHAAFSGAVGSQVDPYFCNGRVARLARDYWTADAAENDTVVLGHFDWTTRFDALSVIEFDDFGSGITLDVGVEVGPSSGVADPDCLIDGQDIATAAGSASLLKSVTIANRHKALWELAGFASAQAARAATVANGGRATVIATLLGGNPGSGTLSWTFYGSPN